MNLLLTAALMKAAQNQRGSRHRTSKRSNSRNDVSSFSGYSHGSDYSLLDCLCSEYEQGDSILKDFIDKIMKECHNISKKREESKNYDIQCIQSQYDSAYEQLNDIIKKIIGNNLSLKVKTRVHDTQIMVGDFKPLFELIYFDKATNEWKINETQRNILNDHFDNSSIIYDKLHEKLKEAIRSQRKSVFHKKDYDASIESINSELSETTKDIAEYKYYLILIKRLESAIKEEPSVFDELLASQQTCSKLQSERDLAYNECLKLKRNEFNPEIADEALTTLFANGQITQEELNIIFFIIEKNDFIYTRNLYENSYNRTSENVKSFIKWLLINVYMVDCNDMEETPTEELTEENDKPAVLKRKKNNQ